jgi:hypothetical protein
MPTVIGYLREGVTLNAAGAGGTIAFDVLTQPTLFYTGTATSNITLNLRGNSGTALDSVMSVGESITCSLLYNTTTLTRSVTALQVDGVGQTVKFLNGTGSFPAGFTGATNAWTFTVIKTAAATFSVLGSVSKFA